MKINEVKTGMRVEVPPFRIDKRGGWSARYGFVEAVDESGGFSFM